MWKIIGEAPFLREYQILSNRAVYRHSQKKIKRQGIATPSLYYSAVLSQLFPRFDIFELQLFTNFATSETILYFTIAVIHPVQEVR
jgi:hypothetical protein